MFTANKAIVIISIYREYQGGSVTFPGLRLVMTELGGIEWWLGAWLSMVMHHGKHYLAPPGLQFFICSFLGLIVSLK